MNAGRSQLAVVLCKGEATYTDGQSELSVSVGCPMAALRSENKTDHSKQGRKVGECHVGEPCISRSAVVLRTVDSEGGLVGFAPEGAIHADVSRCVLRNDASEARIRAYAHVGWGSAQWHVSGGEARRERELKLPDLTGGGGKGGGGGRCVLSSGPRQWG